MDHTRVLVVDHDGSIDFISKPGGLDLLVETVTATLRWGGFGSVKSAQPKHRRTAVNKES